MFMKVEKLFMKLGQEQPLFLHHANLHMNDCYEICCIVSFPLKIAL